jgi:hypothetical protein
VIIGVGVVSLALKSKGPFNKRRTNRSRGWSFYPSRIYTNKARPLTPNDLIEMYNTLPAVYSYIDRENIGTNCVGEARP